MKTYTFSEYNEIQDLNQLDRVIYNISKNKKDYAKLVFCVAVSLPNISHATNNDMGLGDGAFEIIHFVLIFAKYGCMGMGIKVMVEEMLQGANLKEATSAGLQYFIFFIVLSLYPKLFDKIKF